MYDLLREPLVRVSLADGRTERLSLPDLLVALGHDRIAAFPALRPHQRQAWHAFLVQLAALAMHRGSLASPPSEAPAWVDALRALAPDHDDDAPWSLVGAPDRPALLQAPVAGADPPEWKTIATPDRLDMLVTAKNHDLKQALMARAEPDDWLFALVSLQTCAGFGGRSQYGISRMNGGYGSRAAIAVLPPGGPGARWQRDVLTLLDCRNETARQAGLGETGGLGLVWLEPWDGATAIAFNHLDPFYIEICRQVRLVVADGLIEARRTGSRTARIEAGELKGNTGDAWAPIERAEGKALSLSASGFTYTLTTNLLLGEKYRPAPLQTLAPDETGDGYRLLACAISRGQGKTEGYHERIVPLPPVAQFFLADLKEDLADAADRRIQALGNMRGKALRPALFVLFQQGRAPNYQDQTTAAQIRPWLERWERPADASFFDDLWRQLEDEVADREKRYLYWLRDQADRARAVLDAATRSTPLAAVSRYRARARARARLEAGFKFHVPDLKGGRQDERANANG